MSSPLQRFKALPKSLKITTYTVVFLSLYGIAGFIMVPWWAMNYAPALISQQINDRKVSIEAVELNPFALSLTLKNLHIRQHKGLSTDTTAQASATEPNHRSTSALNTQKITSTLEPLVGFDYFKINFQSKSLFTGVFTFDEVTLIKPYGHLSILENEQFNFQDLIPADTDNTKDINANDAPSSDNLEEEGEIPQLLVHHLLIDSANFYFSDFTKRIPYNADIGPLTINLTDFSTEREKNSPYKLQAQSGGGVIGSNLEWEGFLSINPLKSEGQLSIDGVNLSKLAAYVREQFKFEIQQGLLDLNGRYSFDYSGTEPLLNIDQGNITIRELNIGQKDKAESLLRFPSIELSNIDYSLKDASLAIDHFKIRDGEYSLRLSKDGELNLQQLFVTEAGEQVAEETLPDENKEAIADEAPAEEKAHFNFSLAHFELENNAIRVVDYSPSKPMGVDFSNLNLNLKNVNLNDNNEMALALTGRLGKNEDKGDVSISGEIVALPEQRIKLNIDLKQQPLLHFEPYLRDVASIKLQSGFANINGDLHINIAADTPANINFDGDLSLDKFLVTENNVRNKLISFKRFSVNSLSLDTNKNIFKAQTVSLNAPKFWLEMDKQGALNFQRILLTDAATKKNAAADPSTATVPTKSPAKSPQLRLDQFNLTDAEIYYQDVSTTPVFSLGLTEFGGQVKKLSSQSNSKSELDLNGKFDDSAPLSIKGQLNLLSENIYSDIAMDIKNLNMTHFTSYAGTYAGREIDKGQLNLVLNYNILNNHLIAGNTIFIDQLHFGETVESEQATSLPVGLAVALLKNQQGEIHIDMPIEGDIDDPNFRYGKQLWKTFGNVLVNAASSPFKLLAGLVDSDEDLSQITFSASSSLLTNDAIKKLASLEQALLQRPELKLDIEACFNTDFDSPTLKLRVIKSRINPDNKDLTPSKYRQLLADDYQRQLKLKPIYPTYAETVDKDTRRRQDIALLETALIKHQPLSSQALEALAIERRSAIQTQLLASQKISANRLFATAIEEKALEDGSIHCHLSIQ